MKYNDPHRNPLGLFIIFGLMCLGAIVVLVVIDFVISKVVGG